MAFTFLGVASADGTAHPHLVQRLKAAEQFLRKRFPGMKDKDIASQIGWNQGLVSVYGNALTTAHMHTMGLAVDFDASRNPYVYPEGDTIDQKMAQGVSREKAEGMAEWWTIIFDVAFAQAAQLFQGVTLSRQNLVDWSRDLSSEELHARVKSATQAIDSYIKLAEKGSDDEIHDKFKAAGYSDAQAAEALPDMRKFPAWFKDNFSRHTSVINTQSVDLVVALRDAAGLAWGGTELDPNHDNGDFMHFDCRNEGIGQKVMAWNNGKRGGDDKGRATALAEIKRLDALKHPNQ